MTRYDAVVVGLGGMGSAVAAHLSTRGLAVCGLEQFERGHDRGSSSGRSRIIRKVYFEDAAYVPLLHRSYELWQELAAGSDLPIWDLIGVLIVGHRESRPLNGAVKSAALHGIKIEELERAQLLDRYPTLILRSDERGILEPQAGAVFPENAVEAHLRVAEGHGAMLRFNSEVVTTERERSRPTMRVTLADGDAILTERLALCAGPWLSRLFDVGVPLRVQRNVQLWFKPQTESYEKVRFPAFLVDRKELGVPLYGFPDFGEGVKAALHGYGTITTPAKLDRAIHENDIAAVKRPLADWMPGAGGSCLRGKVCMYTLTPDEHFVVDLMDDDPRIAVAGGFSGHGYKFCPVIGEIIADLLIDGTTRHEIGFLSGRRFAASG